MQHNFQPVTFDGVAAALVNGSLVVGDLAGGGVAVPLLNQLHASL